jgi:hypothetical protein
MQPQERALGQRMRQPDPGSGHLSTSSETGSVLYSSLTRTTQHLERILIHETFPATRAAEQLALTLLELASVLPEAEGEQVRQMVSLYDQCAGMQYGPLYRRPQTEKDH